jgi:sulfite reductase alpha subunit-like flavoprotein
VSIVRSCRPQQLAELAADPAAAEAYLAPRHVVDVLRDFLPASAPSAGGKGAAASLLGPAELLGTLRQLQPRLYSISSSQVRVLTGMRRSPARRNRESLERSDCLGCGVGG